MTQNHLVHKRTLNHLVKLDLVKMYLAKWLCVCLWTKWSWVRVRLQSLKDANSDNCWILNYWWKIVSGTNTVKLLYLWHLHKDLYFFNGLTFFENFPNFDGKKEFFFEKSSFWSHCHHIDKCILSQKNLLAPVLLKIMLKLKNPISSCLSILSKSIGEVPYLKPLRRGNIYSRQKK